jgi:hypothetical protein
MMAKLKIDTKKLREAFRAIRIFEKQIGETPLSALQAEKKDKINDYQN